MGAGGSKEHFPELKVVEGVDLTRYMGQWYEYAKLPNRFQSDKGENTTAHYKLREDGKVTVVNVEFVEGQRKSVTGSAWVTDPEGTKSKLKVQFFWPFSSDYWIINLDEDYRKASITKISRILPPLLPLPPPPSPSQPRNKSKGAVFTPEMTNSYDLACYLTLPYAIPYSTCLFLRFRSCSRIEWAVVGEPKRSFLWILSRTPDLDAKTMASITLKLTEQKYDVAKLKRTPQKPLSEQPDPEVTFA